MPRSTFAAQVSAWVAQTKERQLFVFRKAAQRAVAEMQEPGYSKATVKKAIAAGAGLGKVKANGQRGVSKRTYGPIANPGGAGNLPVDTGFLRASLRVSLGEANFTLQARPKEEGTYDYDDGEVNLLIGGAELSDIVYAVYTANYAHFVEYGSRGRPPRAFVRLTAQRWASIVAQVCSEAKAMAGK